MSVRAFVLPITAIFILGSAISGFSQTAAVPTGINDTLRTQVTFGPDQTIEDLMRIKQDMVALGITLNYRELRFTEKNTLERIDFSVTDGTGNSGSASMTEFNRNDPFGFVIDRSKGAPFALGVGHYDHDSAKH